MNKLYLGVIALSLLVVTNTFSMNLVNDDTGIPIAGENKPIKYGLLKYSETIKHLLEDIITTKEDLANLKTNPIPVPNLTMANWNELIPLLENIHNNDLIALNNALKKKKLQHLIAITSGVWNYLDIQPLLNAATIVIADKIKAKKKLVCNAKSLKSLHLTACPAGALVVSIPTGIEKMIAQKMVPISVSENMLGDGSDLTDYNKAKTVNATYSKIINNNGYKLSVEGRQFFVTFEKNDELGYALAIWSLEGTPEIIHKAPLEKTSDIFKTGKPDTFAELGNKFYIDAEMHGYHFAVEYIISVFNKAQTILEAQIYLKKEQGKKLNKDEQKIYDELMKK